MLSGQRTPDVTGVRHAGRLDQHHLHLAVRNRAVLDPARDHEQLPRAHRHIPVPQVDRQAAVDDQEQLVEPGGIDRAGELRCQTSGCVVCSGTSRMRRNLNCQTSMLPSSRTTLCPSWV